MQRSLRHSRGFTLIEIVIVMPMVILMIGAMIGVIIYLTNSSVKTQGRAKLQLDTLASLDRMEQDVKNSMQIKNATASTTSDLTVVELATDKDPLDPTRKLIKASDCTVSATPLSSADALTYEVKYRQSGQNLVREVSFPSGCGATSPGVWQKTGSETLIIGASSLLLQVSYPAATSSLGTAVSIKLTAAKQISGQPVSFTGGMYARSTNIR